MNIPRKLSKLTTGLLLLAILVGVLPAGASARPAEGVTPAPLLVANGSWNALGAGALNGSVYAMAFDSQGNLYVGGVISISGVAGTSNIAKWDGSSWSALGTGVNATVRALAVDSNDNLYAGGDFNVPAARIAKWNGASWSGLGTGMNSSPFALAFDSQGVLYAAGDFTTAGGAPAAKIAKWNGDSWSALDTGMNSSVYALALDSDDNLYAGGLFTKDGTDTTDYKYIAQWDGASWSPLGSGMNGVVSALAMDSQDNLHAGGDFTIAGENTAKRIAKWNGSSWSPLGIGTNNIVLALAFDSQGVLYAGGAFTKDSANAAVYNFIAIWKDNSWSPLDTGMEDTVHSLTVNSLEDVYAGGDFTDASGVTNTTGIAKWDTGNIFIDGFESGDISRWSGFKGAVSSDDLGGLACKLCVRKKGALVGVYSLKVRVPNNKPHYVQDDGPAAETLYNARFKIKRGKTLKMGRLNNFKLMLAKNGSLKPFFLQVRKKGTKFQIRAVAKLDNGKKAATGWTRLPKAATWIEVDWLASDGGNNGHIKLYVNDLLKREKTGLDNDTYSVELVRLGIAAKFKPAFTITGSFKLDGFISNGQYYIGP